MSNYREGGGIGARDQDPIAVALLIFMIIVLLNWLSSSSFSPLPNYQAKGCSAWASSCTNGVGTYDTTHYFSYIFNSVALSGLLKLVVPLLIIMFIYFCYVQVFGRDLESDFRLKINRENIDAVKTATMEARLALAKARMKEGKQVVSKGKFMTPEQVAEADRKKKEKEDQKVKTDYEGHKQTK